jgi:hypothetical protein
MLLSINTENWKMSQVNGRGEEGKRGRGEEGILIIQH